MCYNINYETLKFYGDYMKKETNKLVSIGIRITVPQRAKLDEMAAELGLSVNALLGLMIDNAQLEKVEKVEPVARLKAK
jgi:hypothetical protein